MNTMKIWGGGAGTKPRERRSGRREATDFYAVELSGGARYLRRIRDVSMVGLRLEDRLSLQTPGAIVELELPRPDGTPVRVKAKVVRVDGDGGVGLRALSGPPLDGLGGSIDL